jgi:hypothetical protein
MVGYGVASACDCARREGTSTARIKADTAERVYARIASGEIPLRESELRGVLERMNHAGGNADRSVALSVLEVIIGIGIMRAA